MTTIGTILLAAGPVFKSQNHLYQTPWRRLLPHPEGARAKSAYILWADVAGVGK